MLVFLKSPLGRYAIAALAVIALGFGLYLTGLHNGKSSERAAEARRLEQARKTVAKREVKAAAITQKVGERLNTERVKIEYRTRYLTERIPVASDPSRGSLPAWFVSLHDSAVLGLSEAPGSSVSPDNSPSGVTDAEALKVIIPNYGVCHEYAARVRAWEEFYGQLRETYKR